MVKMFLFPHGTWQQAQGKRVSGTQAATTCQVPTHGLHRRGSLTTPKQLVEGLTGFLFHYLWYILLSRRQTLNIFSPFIYIPVLLKGGSAVLLNFMITSIFNNHNYKRIRVPPLLLATLFQVVFYTGAERRDSGTNREIER